MPSMYYMAYYSGKCMIGGPSALAIFLAPGVAHRDHPNVTTVMAQIAQWRADVIIDVTQ